MSRCPCALIRVSVGRSRQQESDQVSSRTRPVEALLDGGEPLDDGGELLPHRVGDRGLQGGGLPGRPLRPQVRVSRDRSPLQRVEPGASAH
jgi:hypothetical protein